MDPVAAEAQWHMEQVENHARCLRVMGNQTLGDMDMDEADVQQLLDELTDTTNNLAQHSGYLAGRWVIGSAPRVPGHVHEDNTDPPLLELDGQFRKQARYRYKCPMEAIEVRANTKIRKSFTGRSRPMRDDHVHGGTVYHWRAGGQ